MNILKLVPINSDEYLGVVYDSGPSVCVPRLHSFTFKLSGWQGSAWNFALNGFCLNNVFLRLESPYKLTDVEKTWLLKLSFNDHERALLKVHNQTTGLQQLPRENQIQLLNAIRKFQLDWNTLIQVLETTQMALLHDLTPQQLRQYIMDQFDLRDVVQSEVPDWVRVGYPLAYKTMFSE